MVKMAMIDPNHHPAFRLTLGIITILTIWVQRGWALECERQRMMGRHIYSHPSLWNHSIQCPSSFQWEWTLSRICCYDNYDRFYEHPYCCYSEMYKLVVAVGFICLILLSLSFLLFFCWFYNLPHHILYILTFRKFQLNNWLLKARNGPYVDPSFYAKEPFWSRGADAASQLPYPLRPMPPRIFYPAPPSNKFRGWEMGGGDIPLFILASRQFHRNPYSARPQNRTPHIPPQASNSANNNGGDSSRRSSLVTLGESSERGSALERRRGSGWRNSNSSNPIINTVTPIANQNMTSGSNPSSGIACVGVGQSNYTSAIASTIITTNNNRPNSGEIPFIIPMDEHEAETELREALRLMDARVEDDPASSWTIAGDSLGQPTTTIFMTNSSRELVQAQELSLPWHEPIRANEVVRNSANDIDDQQNYITDNLQDHHQQGSTSGSSINSNSESMVGVSRVRFGGKVSVQLLNQQLSNSLGLSLNNLPNIQVIGNFGRDSMETIVEDDDPRYDDEEELDYTPDSVSPQGSRPGSKKTARVSTFIGDEPSSSTPRISSALDRIVTRARQEVPFRPSLPGAIPENPDEGDDSDDTSRRRTRLNRRNSAPVNF